MRNTVEHKSVRELILELTVLEDRIRQVETFIKPSTPGTSPLNPELLSLAQRERQVIAALRRHRARM